MAAATLAGLPSKLVQRASTFTGSGLPSDSKSHSSLKILDDFRNQVKKGAGMVDLGLLPGVIDAIHHNDSIDDRKMLLEHALMLISKMEPGEIKTKLQNGAVELLYNDLPHPATTYVGDDYAWRTADGSNNNIDCPSMGAAGTPYSRSVQQTHPVPPGQMPDAGLIFDTLLRREKFVEHPAGLSSLMFAFAALVIHTVFRTSHENVNINETSSYVDLAPLYGCNQDAQNKIRVRDGRGLLIPDTFSEDRLLLLPPAVAVLLLLFNRNHNYIAKKLLELNERGTWVDPDSIPSDDPKRMTTLLAQDEAIFQTTRLINCGWFASVVMSDYFSAILGLVRLGNNWVLNPFEEMRKNDHSIFERGRGNVCSVEFNCLYRWHSTTSETDAKWVEHLGASLFPDKAPDSLTIMDFKEKFREMQAHEPDLSHWTIGNMQRQEDGTFKDEDLAATLQTATEHPAGAFKARGTPDCMRLHEIMGIESARRWGVCSLNDFRKFLGLKPYDSFLEWNPNPEIAEAAEKLYGDINRLELYTGLQAEEAKPVVDGAGLCPPYTTSRAILADAIALTRGDRFFTSDYTPFNLTSWGFADCQRDPNAPGYGSTLGRLFMRTLPEFYPADSVYTWFPLMRPEKMAGFLHEIGDLELYSTEKPQAARPALEVDEYQYAGQVLGDEDSFRPISGARAQRVVSGNGFFIASVDPARARRERNAMLKALTDAPGSADQIANYFYQKTHEIMVSESWTGTTKTTKSVDIVRDVLNHVPIYWASEVAGIRLRTKGSDSGVYTPAELYTMLTEIYDFLFLDFDQYKAVTLAQRVRGHIAELLEHIKSGYSRGSLFSITGVVHTLSRFFSAGPPAEDYTSRFEALGYDSDTLANSILAVMVGSTVELSQAMTHVVNYYLGPETPASAQATSSKLAGADQAALQGFVLEALRLDPPFTGVFREAVKSEKVGNDALQSGDQIIVNIAKANLDPDVFPVPNSVNPSRMPRERYLVGDGVAKCLGLDLSTKITAATLQAVFSFTNLRRAPGQSGVLKRFKSDFKQTSVWLYLDDAQKPSAWATSMVVQYD